MNKENIQDIYPLAPLQEGMLFHAIANPDAGLYCIQFAFELLGSLDETAFLAAWERVVDRHETLRTSYHYENAEKPLAVVWKQVSFDVIRLDISDASEAEQSARIDLLMAEDATKAFDLGVAPLMRIHLVKRGADRTQAIWTHHHIMTDGWSSGRMLEEVFSEYRAAVSGEPTNLPKPSPYRNYIAWLRKQDRAAGQAFWTRYLAGIEAPTKLAFARPAESRAGQPRQDRVVIRELGGDLLEGAKRFCSRGSLTLNSLLQGCWALAISRYSGDPEVVFGATSSGRPVGLKGVESMVGLFINTLPLRVKIDLDAALGPWLDAFQRDAAETRRYEYCALSEVKSWSEVEGSEALFDSIFVMENAPADHLLTEKAKGLGIEVRGVRILQKTNLPLTMIARAAEGSLVLEALYDANDVTDEAMGRVLDSYQRMLAAIATRSVEEASSLRLRDIELLGEAEKRELLLDLNDTARAYPKTNTIHELFERRVVEMPDAVALAFEDESLTYAQLNERANQVAWMLKNERAVGPERIVGVMLDRSLEMIVGILGILKAGGAYLPIATDYPADRARFILHDSGAAALLTRGAYAEAASLPCPSIDLADSARFAAFSTENPPAQANERNLAYVIYTSGSTGQPKGVMLEHRGVANTLHYLEEQYPLGNDDIYLLKTSYTFDVSVSELFGWYFGSGKLAILPQGAEKDPFAIAAAVARHRATHINFAPSMLGAFLGALEDANVEALGSLKYVLVAGEAFTQSLFDKYEEVGLAAKLENIYGPTEASIYATWFSMSDYRGRGLVPIGRPVPNTAAYILGPQYALLPRGVPGELCLGGVGLARGYLAREELTNDRFVSNPYAPGERMYRTGDLARWLPDGNIEYLGRMDAQVKIRGFRIELGEIETAISKIPGIQETVVVAKEVQGAQALVAYYTAAEALDAAALRDLLKESLPPYMVPTFFVALEEMPHNASGKIDRKSLPEPGDGASGRTGYVAASSEIEQALAEVWQSVLGVERVGVDDDYFDLGGDSIKSIQIVSKLRARGFTLKVPELFAHPRMGDLAKVAQRAKKTIDQAAASGVASLSPIMSWFVEQDFAQPHHWNQAVMLRSESRLDADALRTALATLAERHDSLRLRLSQDGASLAYAPDSRDVFGLEVFDAIESAAIQAEADRIQGSFDLRSGPLSKAALFRARDGDHLLLAAHHLLVDGISWRILFEDLGAAYQAIKDKRNAALPPRTHSFAAWTRELEAYAQTKRLASELPYWKSVCAKALLTLPEGSAGARGDVASQTKARVALDSESTEALLKKAGQAYGTEINDLLLSALEIALGKWMGEGPTLINLESHGREEISNEIDVTRTVGWFTSQYPFLLECGESADVGVRIRRVKERARRVPRKGIGYGVLRYLAKSEGLAATPEISFNYLGAFDGDVARSGLSVSPLNAGAASGGENRLPYALDMNGMLVGGALSFFIGYDGSRFRSGEVEAFAKEFGAALRAVVEHCCERDEPIATPSDFGASWLSIEDLDTLRGRLGARPGDFERICELTPMQLGMLYHQVAEGQSGAYVVQAALDLEGPVDPDACGRAFIELVNRHEALRSRFVVGLGDRPAQVFLRRADGGFAFEDWSARSDEQQERDFDAFLRAERRDGFDLVRESPIRFRLVDRGQGRSRLLVSNHHIVMDGWCLPLLMKEFLQLYSSFKAGRSAELPAAERYSSYLGWLQSTDFGDARDYWRSYLAGLGSATQLPFVQPVAEEDAYENEVYEVPLDARVAKGIPALARRLRATPNSVAQAIWGVLLQRYSNSDDVAFGNVISGRPAAVKGVDGMVGLFINTVPLRVRSPADQAFGDLVAQLQESFRQSEANGFLNLSEVQGLSEVSGELFDHLFVFENYPIDAAVSDGRLSERAGFRVARVRVVEQTNYDLNVILQQVGDDLKVRFEYNAKAFSRDSVERIGRHLARVAETVVANPSIRVAQIDALDAAERSLILDGFKGAEVAYPIHKTLHALFEEQAAKTPGAIAAVFGARSITYAELDARANQLARKLRADHGVGPDTIVALMLERSIEMIVGILGTLKAGGAYLPVDPGYPDDRIAFIAQDSACRAILTQSRFLEKASKAGSAIDLEDVSRLDGYAADNLAIEQSSRDLAYVIYTSGSTGKPKGAMLEHAGAVNRLLWMRDEYGVGEEDVILQKTVYTFDVSVWELLLPGLAGARQVFLQPGGESDPEAIANAIDAYGITTLHFVPSMLSAFLHWLREPRRFASLRRVVCSGEALTVAHKDLFFEKLKGGVELHNLYGPTEASIDVTYFEAKREHKRIPIGRAVANTQLYVLGERDALMPVGAPGELCLAGIQLARGYLNRPDLTAAKFVANPFQPGERMYRTGDLARWLPDGNVEYLGRIDNQVKLRGFRIELGEIEAEIRKQPGVQEVVVVARQVSGDDALVAYFSTAADVAIDALREALRKALPSYMVPSYFVSMERIPLSANGKIDRKALPAPDGMSATTVEFVAPRSDTERSLAEIWQAVLAVEQIGIDHDFFELGGHSIKAIQLLGRINHAFDANLQVGDLYKAPTIRKVAEVLASDRGGLSLGQSLELGHKQIASFRERIATQDAARLPDNYEDIYPITPIELGMIYSSELAPEQPIYYDQFVYHFRSHDIARVRDAFARLVEVHEILRTRYYTKSLSEPAKVVMRSLDELPLSVEDISGRARPEQLESIREYQQKLSATRSSFDGEILWRMHCFQLDAERYVGVLSFHHSVLDGWSVNVLMNNLLRMLSESEGKEIAGTRRLKSSYKDYCAIQLGKSDDPATARFWKEKLDGCARNKLPFNYAGKRRRDSVGMGVARRYADVNLLASIQKLATEKRVSLKSVFLAAQAYMTRLASGEREIVTGLVSHDRPAIADGESILGCFLSTIPIRIELAERETPAAIIEKTHSFAIEASSHELHLTDVARAVGGNFGNANPFFDCLLNFTDFEVGGGNKVSDALEDSREDWFEGEIQGEEMTNTLFDLEVDKTFGRLYIRIKYSPSYFDHEDMEYAIDLYIRILERFVQDPEMVIAPDQLVAESERRFLVDEFNATETPYSENKRLHELFEERAAAQPEAEALSQGGKSMSYGELNARSNQLARRLVELGVRPADDVGLIVERCFDMIIGMLGILKAGAAYVPVDPTYPLERQAYILKNSSATYAVAGALTDVASAEQLGVVQLVRVHASQLDGYATDNLGIEIDPAQLAYTIYTSGSTGNPKGVMIEHRSAVNLVEWVNKRFEVGPSDRLLFISSMCFDLSVYDVFGILAAGGAVCIATLDQVRDFQELKRLMVDERITFWDTVPTTMDYLVRELEFEGAGALQNDLRLVFMSGDWIPVTLPERIVKLFPNAKPISLGGATEGTVWSNFHPIEKVDASWSSIPYGKPIDNNFFYIVDDDCRLVPPGAVGELCIGGLGVAVGYANDPEKTAAAFVEDPFKKTLGGRMYRTGDLGRMTRFGEMEFLGRKDHQVKIRGYRVELGEIESRLARRDGIKAAVVDAKRDANGNSYLVAYVVSPESIDAAALRDYVASTLPFYMVPSQFVQLDALPLTSNGKVNRKALPDPEQTAAVAKSYAPPRDAREEALVGIWQEVLKVEKVGIDDNFFDLGGHSLMAVSAVSKIRKTLEVELSLREIFEYATIRELSEFVKMSEDLAQVGVSESEIDETFEMI